LHKLRGTSTGAQAGSGVMEWEVALKIAELTKVFLEEQGLVVDLLPATIPVDYYADAFVSIHADGNVDRTTRGFKVAPPWRDFSGKSKELSSTIERVYLDEVGFPIDPLITRNMRGYYAFSWWRYDHAIHPMSPAAILETGFLSNPTEAGVLINNPELPARALADAILHFMKQG
jgi:N-acetylmuramoyl-L-alanine amidase